MEQFMQKLFSFIKSNSYRVVENFEHKIINNYMLQSNSFKDYLTSNEPIPIKRRIISIMACSSMLLMTLILSIIIYYNDVPTMIQLGCPFYSVIKPSEVRLVLLVFASCFLLGTSIGYIELWLENSKKLAYIEIITSFRSMKTSLLIEKHYNSIITRFHLLNLAVIGINILVTSMVLIGCCLTSIFAYNDEEIINKQVGKMLLFSAFFVFNAWHFCLI
jgi:hypothetical protein